MSEHNSIYDTAGLLVGRFRFGIAWSAPDMIRLGEYDHASIRNDQGTLIANIQTQRVFDLEGNSLGYLEDKSIYVGDAVVGSYIGCSEAGAAAIALIFNPPLRAKHIDSSQQKTGGRQCANLRTDHKK